MLLSANEKHLKMGDRCLGHEVMTVTLWLQIHTLMSVGITVTSLLAQESVNLYLSNEGCRTLSCEGKRRRPRDGPRLTEMSYGNY